MDPPEDIRLFEIFHIKCLPTIPGYTASKIWPIVPQLGTTEPAIRHAMLAIASLYEETEAVGRPFNENSGISEDGRVSQSEAVAMKHYTKALCELQQVLGSKASSKTVVLIACMLFICIEALRGQDEAALAHIENGIKITTNFKTRHENNSVTDQRSPTISQSSQLSESLSGAFSRMRILSLSIQEQKFPGKFKIASSGALTDCPPKFNFSSLTEARIALNLIMNNVANVVYGAPPDDSLTAASLGPDTAVASRIQVDAQIRLWSRAFNSFMAEALQQGACKDSSTVEHLNTNALILRAFAKLISIRLWISYMPEGDPSHNALIPDFEELLDLAEQCTISQSQGQASIPGNKTQPPLFIMDMGIIPVLSFAACRCPSITLRQRAIEMLERNPRREVLWCSTTAARNARSLMELEKDRLVST